MCVQASLASWVSKWKWIQTYGCKHDTVSKHICTDRTHTMTLLGEIPSCWCVVRHEGARSKYFRLVCSNLIQPPLNHVVNGKLTLRGSVGPHTAARDYHYHAAASRPHGRTGDLLFGTGKHESRAYLFNKHCAIATRWLSARQVDCGAFWHTMAPYLGQYTVTWNWEENGEFQ